MYVDPSPFIHLEKKKKISDTSACFVALLSLWFLNVCMYEWRTVLTSVLKIFSLPYRSGILSESEAEDDPSAHVTVSSKVVKCKAGPQKSAVRLSELGPRMTLKVSCFCVLGLLIGSLV